MAAVTVQKIEQGWAGDRKRHLAVVLVSSDSTVTPEQVGLQHIEFIEQGVIKAGTVAIGGTTVALTACGVTATYATQSCTFQTATASGNVLLYFYGW